MSSEEDKITSCDWKEGCNAYAHLEKKCHRSGDLKMNSLKSELYGSVYRKASNRSNISEKRKGAQAAAVQWAERVELDKRYRGQNRVAAELG